MITDGFVLNAERFPTDFQGDVNTVSNKLSEIQINRPFLVRHVNSDWSWIFEICIIQFSLERKAIKVSKQISPEGSWYTLEDFNTRFEFVDFVEGER